MSFDFENISKIIAERAKGAFVDVCVVINNVGPVDTINTRAGATLEKRDLEVVDDSTKEKLRCTLWGQQAVEVKLCIYCPIFTIITDLESNLTILSSLTPREGKFSL